MGDYHALLRPAGVTSGPVEVVTGPSDLLGAILVAQRDLALEHNAVMITHAQSVRQVGEPRGQIETGDSVKRVTLMVGAAWRRPADQTRRNAS